MIREANTETNAIFEPCCKLNPRFVDVISHEYQAPYRVQRFTAPAQVPGGGGGEGKTQELSVRAGVALALLH